MKEQDITCVECKKVRPAKSAKKGLAPAVLDQLHDSISKEGLLNPVCLRPDPENPGCYRIVAGEHRFYVVSKMMKADVVAARIFDEMSDEEAELAGLSENACRTHAKPTDRLLHLRKWQEVYRKHFPALEGCRGAATARWANSTKAEAKQKAIDEERAKDAAEAAAACDDQNGHRIEGDAPTADTSESKERPKTFRERVKAVTGMSESALTRDLKINNSLDEEQVYVLDLVQCTKQGMIQIIDATKDIQRRGEIVNLVASGMEIDRAIVEVLGEQAGTGTHAEGDEANAGPRREETDEEWFLRECAEFSGYLGEPDQFRSDAILFRQLSEERNRHRKKVKKIVESYKESRKGKRIGWFFLNVFNYLNVSHPNSWAICGACKGKGTSEAGEECSTCRGAGYKTKTERYV